MNDHKLKAADLVVEALKAILGLATLLFGGLIGLFQDRTPLPGLAVTGLGLFLVAAVLSLLSILSLVNKVHAGEAEAIKRGDVRGFFIGAALALCAGLIVGAVALRGGQAIQQHSQGLPNTTIDDRTIRIGTAETGTVTVSKSPTGAIEKIVVTPIQGTKP